MIETKRLILRRFQIDDFNDVYEYLKEPLVNCFASLKVNSLEEAKIAVDKRIKQECCFAVVLKENNKVIGEIDAISESSHPDHNFPFDTYSPCWMINKEYHRQGYALEAAIAFFEYLFTIKEARRIYVYTEDYNIACQQLCNKLGMRKEGEYKEFVTFVNDLNGTPIYENTIQYAILKKEWNKK